MNILMLVNWKINYCDKIPMDKQPPDFYTKDDDYWFFKYFDKKPHVDVVDISSFKWLENFEKNKTRFYIWQTLKVLPRLNKYDLVVSHGMQSGVVLSLIRRFFKTKAKHIVFDIGSFNSAAEDGFALKLMQFASRSIDYVIYHTSTQIEYYRKCFPWIAAKSTFVKFGTDTEYFDVSDITETSDKGKYIICTGYAKRDWDTLVKAYEQIDTDVKLRFVGHIEDKYKNKKNVEQIPYIPIQELKSQIYNSLFAILPLESFNYSYGQMTLMQQMAMEKCVVAAAVPSLNDYMYDEKTAITYTPKNHVELKEKIEILLADREKIETIGKAARKFLLSECNEKIMAKEIEKVFQKCLGIKS